MMTAFVLMLAATSSEVSTSRPRCLASSNHANAWAAIVTLLLAATPTVSPVGDTKSNHICYVRRWFLPPGLSRR
ncbi:hypothetical protein GCM10009541_08810 [Micromonospora gifhornensis]|uniref:Secreted protein n=1 Tax=Micromonospora gifhornensis TaxID=84594 RepID=A0ABQ4IBE4_9ACTN|nr:hypothetical protein Vgi01_19190 [Micromonospora gifhornensis]